MTGIEGLALGAVNRVGSEVAASAKAADPVLADLARSSEKMAEASELYARKTLVREKIQSVFWRPFEAWFDRSRGYFDNRFSEDLAEAMIFMPQDDIVEPRASVAVPAIEGLAFSHDEPALKDMYISLLASAADGREPEKAHPAYASVIKQLSAREAVMFNLVARAERVPVVALRRTGATDGTGIIARHQGFTFKRHILPFTKDGQPWCDDAAATYVDNWIRLGLVDVSYETRFVRQGAYEWAEEWPDVLQARSETKSPEVQLKVIQGYLRVTDFGQSFAAAVGIPRRTADLTVPERGSLDLN